jgi:prepilin-type N-terminal cleavage/methylation domain-containing protein
MNRRPSGFTLMETLVAIALFGLAAGVLMMAVGNLSRGLTRDGATSEDDFMQDFVLHVVLAKSSRDEVLRGGTLTLPGGEKLHWDAKVDPATIADLHRLTIRYPVSGYAGGEHVVRALAHKVEWSDPVARAVRLDARREELPSSRLDH